MMDGGDDTEEPQMSEPALEEPARDEEKVMEPEMADIGTRWGSEEEEPVFQTLPIQSKGARLKRKTYTKRRKCCVFFSQIQPPLLSGAQRARTVLWNLDAIYV